MQVIITTPSKYHIFKLARYLAKNNLLKYVITGNIKSHYRNENIPPQKLYSIPVIPILYLINKVQGVHNVIPATLFSKTFDLIASQHIHDADVFIGFPGWMLHSAYTAKRNIMRVIAEGGSTHILNRENVLKNEFSKLGLKYKPHPASLVKLQCEEYRAADFITVPSEHVKQSFIKYGIPEKKLVKIPYGIEDFFLKENNFDKEKRNNITITSPIGVIKGTHYTFEVIKRLKKFYNIKFHLIGFLRPDIKPIIQKNSHLIDFIGTIKHNNLPSYLENIDILLHPSIDDGFPLLPVEAMARGVIPLLSHTTGSSEIIKNGVDGFVVHYSDVDYMVEIIKILIENEELRKRISRNARKKATLYTEEEYYKKYVEFLRRVVK